MLLNNIYKFGSPEGSPLRFAMAQNDPVRIIPHSPEGIRDTGSFEVVWPGGRQFVYWDDIPGRRLRPDALSRGEALEQARALAREKRGGP